MVKTSALLSALCLAVAVTAAAQSTTGTISGRVIDTQGLPVPGVTVTATSPNLQGERQTVTSENGDYILTLLPPGVYTLTFELSGFETQKTSVSVAPTQVVPANVRMGIAGLTETVDVTGRAADPLTQTAQVATNFSQELLSTLPTTRDVRAAMLLAPSVHPTGPNGSFSVAGSMSFENLFMINGVTVNENLRGQPNELFIEDAVQETIVATAGISAEFGRFGGGVVNVITRSGGNRFSGSFRETLMNDRWRELVPGREGDTFTADSTLDRVVPTHEYTFGGPVLRDRLWFFHAGRLQKQEFNRQLVQTNIPYVFTDDSKRFEGKVTFALDANHRFQGAFTKINRDQLNNTFSQTASMDLNSLEDRSTPEDLFTVNYTGVVAPTLFVEARYSQRNFTFSGSGSRFTDLLRGTLLVDPSGRRYHSATFCGVCDDEERDNQDLFVKGSYFLSTGDAGSHNIVFGYDLFNDKRFANNHQSGSDYRILNAPAIVQGDQVIASFVSGTSQIQWNPIFIESQGTNFRTHSLFFNDNWQIGRVTANLGIRWDRNDGRDSNDALVADQSTFSPRLGLSWDPVGDGRWSVTGSVAKYVAGILNSIADIASPAGNPDTYRFLYEGPDINVAAVTFTNEQALQQLFDWFFANGGPALPIIGSPSVGGISPQVGDDLSPPHVWEYAAGVNRQFSGRTAARVDVVFRDYGNFYIQRTDTTTGQIVDDRPFAPPGVLGQAYDLTLIENDKDDRLDRRYAGLTFQAQHRLTDRIDFGGNYTLSRAWGNLEGETVPQGAVPAGDSGRSGLYDYPEYREERWNAPEGDLSVDQRHRARLWINVGVPRIQGLTVSLLQALESGVPYSASNQNAVSLNGVDPRPFVNNPGYLNPPDGSVTQYFFTERDAFRLEGQKRTDLGLMYSHRLRAGAYGIDLFVQGLVINLFNQFQQCGCGGNAQFSLGGNVQNQTVDTTVRTNVSHPTLYQPFNPFTETPVEGVHWAKGPAFGTALNRFAYTTPRTFRVNFGVRF